MLQPVEIGRSRGGRVACGLLQGQGLGAYQPPFAQNGRALERRLVKAARSNGLEKLILKLRDPPAPRSY